jgi:hypothetical protein
MSKDQWTPTDQWQALILYGLNTATYKIALGRLLLEFASQGKDRLYWSELSERFLRLYRERLKNGSGNPQQGDPTRKTKMERIISALDIGKLSETEALETVAREAFNDVVPRFQNLSDLSADVAAPFYEFTLGKELVFRQELLAVASGDISGLLSEIDARWSLLEGAFLIRRGDGQLENDIRESYLKAGTLKRASLAPNIPFLQGYQGNVCFYCGESLATGSVAVDHVLPRAIMMHDELWNLVLTHEFCNSQKLDKLIDQNYLQKLCVRNENVMGSQHPWRSRIAQSLGTTPSERRRALEKHYENVRIVLKDRIFRVGMGANPDQDPFYRRLITRISMAKPST